MKPLVIVVAVCVAMLSVSGDAAVCVNGDSDTGYALFSVDPIPSPTSGDTLVPEVVYSTDSKPMGIKWTAAEGLRRVMTVIGRYDKHDIIDLTYFHSDQTTPDPDKPFAVKLLAYRAEDSGSAPIKPFFILTGENVRWYEQIIEGAPNKPFRLIIRNTCPGNGVMWSTYSFRFSPQTAWIENILEGGRKMLTTCTTYSKDGKVQDIQKSNEN